MRAERERSVSEAENGAERVKIGWSGKEQSVERVWQKTMEREQSVEWKSRAHERYRHTTDEETTDRRTDDDTIAKTSLRTTVWNTKVLKMLQLLYPSLMSKSCQLHDFFKNSLKT